MEYIFIGIGALAFVLGIGGLSLAPWVPTRKKDYERIHRASSLKKGDVFYELGCGDGRVCFYIAKENPEATIVGIELSIVMFLIAVTKKYLLGARNVRIKLANALYEDFSKVDVLYVYAVTETLDKKLSPKLHREMRKGSRFISYDWYLSDWDGDYYKLQESDHHVPLHVYKK